MGLLDVFKKVGKKLISREVLEVAGAIASVKVPVLGIALKLALEFVDRAEEEFKNIPKSGETHKRPWVDAQLKKAYEERGI